MNKTELRKLHKNIRNLISDEEQIYKSSKIQSFFNNLQSVKDSKCIFVYLAYGKEVLTGDIISEFIHNKDIVIPECDIQSETMICVKMSESSEYTKNHYGIKEILNPELYKGDIDIAVVPGIAFDIKGNRIGHGKGYYDKFLKDKDICKIGLCYSDNLINSEIECDSHDIKMDYIITDREVLKIKSWFRLFISQN